MAWADEPNVSRTLHGIVQIAILVFFLCWLKKNHQPVLLRGLATGAVSLVILLVIVAIRFYMDHQLTTPLYATGKTLPFGLPEMNMLRLTMIATFTVFILAAFYLQSPHQTGRMLFMALAATLVVLLMLTQRRTALVALTGGLIVGILLTRSRVLIMVVALVLLSGGLFLITDINGYLSDGSSYRLELWSAYLQKAMDAPLGGIGLPYHPDPATVPDGKGSTFTGSHAHNIYLAILVYSGGIGLTLFALAWLYPALVAWKGGVFDKKQAVYFMTTPPALLVMLFNGGYPVLPFQPNWFGLWLPLSLLIAFNAGCRPTPARSNQPAEPEDPKRSEAEHASGSGI
jgi:O-antigen ligase